MKKLIFILTMFVFCSTLFSATYNVPTDYSTIQLAIDNASDGDTITVSNGTYYENLLVNNLLTIKSVNGSAYCTINGSYNSLPCVRLMRGANGSTIQGFKMQNGTGYSTYNNPIGGSSVWCNVSSCTVKECHMIGPSTPNVNTSFGVYSEASITIDDNTFGQCRARQLGGAIMINGADAVIKNNYFNGCRVDQPTGTTDHSYGGAIYLFESDSTVFNNEFEDCHAKPGSGNSMGRGGAIAIKDCYPTISSNTIWSGGSYYGAGIYVDVSESEDDAYVYIYKNDIYDNRASWATGAGLGGGIYIKTAEYCSVYLDSNTITENFGYYRGGGVYFEGDGNLYSTCNFIYDNQAGLDGYREGNGGGYCLIVDGDGCIQIVNDTIRDNICVDYSTNEGIGGGIYASHSGTDNYDFDIYNTMFYQNFCESGTSTDSWYIESSNPGNVAINFEYCRYESGEYSYTTGITLTTSNNITTTPVFQAGSDYKIASNCPCVESGANSVTGIVFFPTKDIDDQTRKYSTYVDIGCYEYQ